MADKPDKKPAEPADAHGAEKKKEGGKLGGMLAKTPVLMVAVMLVEAVVLIGGFKFLAGGGPKAADGAEAGAGDHGGGGHDDHGGGDAKPKEKKKTVEIPLVELRGTNRVSGRTLLFDVALKVNVKGEHEEAVKKMIADRQGLITDRVLTIIAQSDPEKLTGGSEPGRETFRRQVRYQLEQIIEKDGMIDEVLVQRCIPFRADL
jgi:flagellar basal body-associated protein FliL